MQSKQKNKEADEANEIDVPRNEQTGYLKNFEYRLLRDLVCIASAKARKDFNEHRNLKPLADQPKRILDEIVDVQVQLRRSGRNDDAGRPIIEVSQSFKFRGMDILRELDRHGKRAGAFSK